MKCIDIFWDLDLRLQEAGIQKGDIVYVASNMRSLLYLLIGELKLQSEQERDDVLHTLTNHLQSAVGEEGTLLFPVFTWDFCKGKEFDYYKTQGKVGIYPNWILNKRKDFKRTRHPIYSFMVWGKNKDFLCRMDNQEAWGENSPFWYVLKHGGKQMNFNVEAYRSLTFAHCFEQWSKVPYRHHKFFFGKYTDELGNAEIRSYSMYVRDLEVSERIKVTNEYLLRNSVAKQAVWQGNILTLIDLQKCRVLLEEDIINNEGKETLHFDDYQFRYGEEQTIPYEIGWIPDLVDML